MPNPPAAQRHRVLIIEDQTAIREMLAVLVGTMDDFELIGHAGTLAEAKRLTGELRPDIVLLDWTFPGGSGAELLAELKRAALLTEVLVFSAITSPHAVRAALTGGAKGYIEKGASMAELREALRAVAAGRAYFGPEISRTVNQLVCQPADSTPVLSAREREVLTLVAEGRPSKEIAVLLDISLKTVNHHRTSLSAKTGLHSIAELTMHAARMGLIPGPTDRLEAAAAEEPVGVST